MLICTLGLTAALAAERPAAKITFTPRLTKGDRFTLEITKGRTQTGRPDMAKVRGFQVVEIEVLDTSKNILIKWTSLSTGVIGADGKAIKLPAQAAAMTTAFDGVKMIFELTPKYEMIGLKNLDEIRPAMTRLFDKTLAVLERSDEDKAQLRKVMASMLKSKETIEMICGKQISLLLGLSQLEIEGRLKDKPKGRSTTQFPLPFGGAVIPAEILVEVASHDPSKEQAAITIHTTMDPEKAADAMFAAVKAINKKTGKPAPSRKDMPKLEIKDVRTYLLDLKTNLPLSAMHMRGTKAGPGTRTDIVKIVRKPARARGKQKPKK
jgi:hypothetical protein